MQDYEKRGYLLENFRLFHLKTEQAPSVEYHYHTFCKLLFFVSGRGSYTVEGQRYRLRAGDVVLIGSNCVHRPELEPDTPYERIIIYISPKFLARESTGDCPLQDCFSGENGHVLRLRDGQRKELYETVEALENELRTRAYGWDIASNAALLGLLIRISRELQRDDIQNPMPLVTKNQNVLAWMQYLDTHLEEDLDIGSLAERFYISKYHMMRLFHRETGVTVYTYLQIRRLLRARELMGQGLRATDACYRCGFRTYSSFTRAYSKYFGTTPTGRADATHRLEESYE